MSQFVEYTEPVWRGMNMRDLKVDEAYLVVKSHYNKPAYLYSRSEECYTCPFSFVKSMHNFTFKLNVARGWEFKVYDKEMDALTANEVQCNDTNCNSVCDLYASATELQEFGVYNFTLHENGSCELITDKAGVNVNLSLASVFILVTLVLAAIRMACCAWRSYTFSPEAAAATEINAAVAPAQTSKRMRSLDAFRGMAIVLMIFVNSGGGDYWWIEHAPWNGLHLADVVFPSFLWIMGVCIPISIKSQVARGTSKARICRRIVWRSLKLFAIGVCLNSINGPQMSNLRIMGVLQRFAVAYLVCGLVHTVFIEREFVMPQIAWKRALCDIILLKTEFLVMLSLIAIYLGLIFGLPVPNCPTGYLGPGGKHANAQYPNCTGGANGYVDRLILGDAHIYQHPTAKFIYGAQAFDPEGVFGCLLTVVQAFLGVLAGVIILVHTGWSARIKRWLYWSLALALLGGALCFFTVEAGPIPINKNLWSLSFVCVTSALAFFMLSILYFVIDVRRWWTGYPFVESGMNAIIMYVGHTVMHKMLPWHWRIGPMNTHFVLLLEATWNTLLWVAIALYLDSIKFYYSL
ncbi:heparan-alpha-glucosaminide N-acetyltransferase [Bactrocera tryoni]|uniref:heparan-alpha-glucosaminide N-acetyltransferase n=1 Tax=Bactrocera tryoni TaxID=59916 RepID=UPI001A995D30|nr:heparan-alpha-glucosaminide N-acetyltransferase [Bactrocera tryoni]XP_039958206.1 heparan-alpha-glucosaminide N-acetyltransferase [Bactrocera tryoni]XP_039958207.1 heparan-alpha-glucosaminide N-acetyltransferase [Bactrocera tryoni]XP_039958208.1 heparan-alpha-glucosaminide N-acetyltransferase [Bactrocera tryoni]XP_039958209.1 heparan-alpha-glucosaminide N-acetyltransferase [Bactrocera tryoni]XP_039958210.1 heparan-alpha-glucosaminide N-acetyltransferase [Bactrocera tryoni]